MDGHGKCALVYAAETGRSVVLQQLVDGGADVNLTNKVMPLRERDWAGREPEDCGAALDSPVLSPQHGTTPLIAAVKANQESAVSVLLQMGADVRVSHAAAAG